jgi:aryl sulfotransferase
MSNITVAGYPKCGNTWIGYLLSYYLNVPFYDAAIEESVLRGELSTDNIRYTYNHDGFRGEHFRRHQEPGVRSVIKTHARPDALQTDHPRFLQQLDYRHSDPHILITRDPRDVAVSYFYYRYFRMARVSDRWHAHLPYALRDPVLRWRFFGQVAISTAQKWSQFSQAWLEYGPLVIRYEDLLVDAAEEIRRVAKALGFQYDPACAREATAYCSFGSLRQREDRKFAAGAENERFFRSGRSGGWKSHFSDKLTAKVADIAGPVATRLGYSI